MILTMLVICPAEALEESDLPFDNAAPTHMAVNWMEGNDSPTYMALSLSIDRSVR